MARFFPGKATFGRAIGMGIYAVAMQTVVGAAMTGDQQQRAEWAESSRDFYNEENYRETTNLFNRIYELQQRLSRAEEELTAKGAEYERARRAWKADMDGTVKYVHKLRGENEELRSDLEEISKERDELKSLRDSTIYPRMRKGEARLECPALDKILDRLLTA